MLGIDINQINQMRGNQLMGHAREIASNDPILKAYVEAIFRYFNGRNVSDLNNNGRSLYSLAEGVASNFVGNAPGNVAAFGGLNTVLASMPMNVVNPEQGMSTSYGSGVNTMTVAQQIARGIQNKTDFVNGYHGLSAPLAMGLAGRIIKDNGNVGQVNNIDIASNSSGVASMRRELQTRGNITEGSYVDKKLETLENIMDKMERHNVSVGNMSEGMKDLFKNKYGFSEEDILAADKARSGKLNATFLDAGSEEQIHKGIKQYSDTIKTLSELFRTEDFNQLEQQAKQLGIQSLTSKNGAEKIRQITRAAVNSAIATGQTTDVVLQDMGAISSALAANNGGRASATGTTFMYDAISEARNSETAGARSTYTANEKAAIAMNQMAETEEDYGSIYGAQEAFRIADSYGQLSDSQKEQYYELEKKIKSINKLPPQERLEALENIKAEYEDFASSIGFNATDQKLIQQGIANRTEDQDLTKVVAGDVNGYNEIRLATEEIFNSNSNLDSSRLNDVVDTTEIIRSTFGGDDKAVDDFMKLASQYDKGKVSDEEFISKLVAMGMDEQDALTVKDKKLNALELNTMYQVRDTRRQNFQYKGTAQRKKEKTEEAARMIAQSQDLYKSSRRPDNDFLAGLISTGSLTEDELLARDILKNSEQGPQQIGSLTLDSEGKIANTLELNYMRQRMGYNSAEDLEEWEDLDLSDNAKVQEFLEKKAAAAGKHYDKATGKLYDFNAERDGIASDDNLTALSMQVGQNGTLVSHADMTDESTQKRMLKAAGLDGADEITKNKFLEEFTEVSKTGSVADMNDLINKYSEGKNKLIITDKGYLATSSKDYSQQEDSETVRKSAAILSSLKGEGSEGDISFDGSVISANFGDQTLDSNQLKDHIANKTLDEHTLKMITEDPRKFQEIMSKAKSGDAAARMFVDYVKNGIEKSTSTISVDTDTSKKAASFREMLTNKKWKTDDDIDLFSVKTDTEAKYASESERDRRGRALEEANVGDYDFGNRKFTFKKNFLGFQKGETYDQDVVMKKLKQFEKARDAGEHQSGFNAEVAKELLKKFDKDMEDPDKRKEADKNLNKVDTKVLEELIQKILDFLKSEGVKMLKGGANS